MKLGLALSAGFLFFTTSVFAADGTINFTGSITASTCKINGQDGGAATQTVNLGNVPASALASVGSTAGNKNFSLILSGCSDAVTGVAAHFESLALGADNGRLNLDASSGAKNVQIALYDDKGTLQPVNGEIPASSYVTVSSAAGGSKTATLNYIAAYYATGTAEAGTANSTVSYTLNYQ